MPGPMNPERPAAVPSMDYPKEVPLAQLNQERAALEQALEPYQQLVMNVYSNVLMGRKPALGASFLGAIYVGIWLLYQMELPFLALVSFLGMMAVACRFYFVTAKSSFVNHLTKLTALSSSSEASEGSPPMLTFSEICGVLITTKNRGLMFFRSVIFMRDQQPVTHAMVVAGTLAVLFVIGMVFSTIFLIYLTVTIIAVAPALHHYKIFSHGLSSASPGLQQMGRSFLMQVKQLTDQTRTQLEQVAKTTESQPAPKQVVPPMKDPVITNASLMTPPSTAPAPVTTAPVTGITKSTNSS